MSTTDGPELPRYPSPAEAPPLPPPPPGWGRLEVDCSYSRMVSMFGLVGTVVMVDGVCRGTRWGRTVVDLPAGRHDLFVYVPYGTKAGKADAVVSVAPGESITMHYRAPLAPFAKGALGREPQRSPGLVLAVAMYVVAIVVVVGAFLL